MIEFITTGGYGGTAVPYMRATDLTSRRRMAVHNSTDSFRLARYEEGWRFYTGAQWGFSREAGDNLVTANYCKVVVNKKASWMVGKGTTLAVPEAFQEHTKPVIEKVWKYNGGKLLELNIAKLGGITGDVDLLPVYQQPSAKELALDPRAEGKIVIRVLRPETVFPVFDPTDSSKLLAVRVVTEVDLQTADPRVPDLGFSNLFLPNVGSLGASPAKRARVEVYTNNSIITGWEGGPWTEEENLLGEIPLVHIANESVPTQYYGMSDLDGIIDLQREFNEKMTDVSDVIHYHAQPITVVLGAKVAQLEKGAKSLWAFTDHKVQVKTLEYNGDMPAANNYLKSIQGILFDVSGIPEGSLGRIQAISNTSSAALQVQFQPLVETTERKQASYGPGLERLNYLILRYHEIIKSIKFRADMCRSCGGRILEFDKELSDGTIIVQKRCFMVDPQTHDFLKPEEMPLNVKRKHSFGDEVREVSHKQLEREYGKRAPSYWDPAPVQDLRQRNEVDQEVRKKAEAEAASKEAEIGNREAETHEADLADREAERAAKNAKE